MDGGSNMHEEIKEITERQKMLDYIVEHEANRKVLQDIKNDLYDHYRPASDEAIRRVYTNIKEMENIKNE